MFVKRKIKFKYASDMIKSFNLIDDRRLKQFSNI